MTDIEAMAALSLEKGALLRYDGEGAVSTCDQQAMVERAAEALYLDSNNYGPGCPYTEAALGQWPPRPEYADWWREKARLALSAAMRSR